MSNTNESLSLALMTIALTLMIALFADQMLTYVY